MNTDDEVAKLLANPYITLDILKQICYSRKLKVSGNKSVVYRRIVDDLHIHEAKKSYLFNGPFRKTEKSERKQHRETIDALKRKACQSYSSLSSEHASSEHTLFGFGEIQKNMDIVFFLLSNGVQNFEHTVESLKTELEKLLLKYHPDQNMSNEEYSKKYEIIFNMYKQIRE